VPFDSTKTSMSGGRVVAFNSRRSVARCVTARFVRLASPEMELNDAGLVPTHQRQVDPEQRQLRSLRPRSWYRSSFSMIETRITGRAVDCRAAAASRSTPAYSLLNNWGWALTLPVANPNTNYCTSCARGGPALRMEPLQFFQVNVNGDSRRSVIPQLQWA
jgi:hypothetical protein